MSKVFAVPGMQPFVAQKQSKERAQNANTANAQKVQSVPSFKSNSNASRAALAYGTVRVKSDTSFKGHAELVNATLKLCEDPLNKKALNNAASCIKQKNIPLSSINMEIDSLENSAITTPYGPATRPIDSTYGKNLNKCVAKLRKICEETYGKEK